MILLAGGACAVLRPLVWALHDESPSRAVLRAAILFISASSIVAVGVAIYAWRRRPSLLSSARHVDDALGLQEVVASGFAFERDARADEMSVRAIEKAREATHGVDVAKALRTKAPKANRGRFFWRTIALAAIGLGVGAIDRLIVDRALHPMTARENAASTDLKRAAEAAQHAQQQQQQNDEVPKNPKADEVVEAAKRAAAAAERGDRKRAAEALEDMRKAQRAMEADDRAQAKSLKDLRDEIEAKNGGSKRDGADPKEQAGGRRPSATASEALEKTKRDLDAAAKSKDPEELKKLAERLARAEAAASRAAAAASAKSREEGGKEGGKEGKEGSKAGKSAETAWSRAAEALKEAREAAARGDAEGAKRATERAEREIASLEKAREGTRAVSKLSEHASELDRAMRGGSEKSPGEKDGESDGTGKAEAKNSKTGGQKNGTQKGDPSGQPGGGPGEGDRNPSAAEQRKLKVNGDLQARTDVREGERAAGVIQGMGKGGDPHAYKEVFPSYDSVVEEGLRDDAIPAARRPAVRRYFSSIRPSEESGNQK